MTVRSDQAELVFPLKAGAAIRGHVRREIESAAWTIGLDVDVEESKGLFVSLYKFTVSGPEEDVQRFSAALLSWLDSLDSSHAGRPPILTSDAGGEA